MRASRKAGGGRPRSPRHHARRLPSDAYRLPAPGENPDEQLHRLRDERRAEQARVVKREAPLVLGQAQLQERAQPEVAEGRMALQRESVLSALLFAVASTVAASGHLERALHAIESLRGDVPGAPRVEHRPQRKGPTGAQVCRPIHDEEDMPRLLLHDLVEQRDQVLVEKLAPAPDVEETEGEERVEAFAVARAQKGPRRILGFLRLPEGSGRNPVSLRQQGNDLRVAPLLVPLQGDGFLQDGIRLLVPQSLHLDRRGGFRARRLVPDGEVLQPRQALLVQLGPDDVLRPEGMVRLDECPAEETGVFLRSDSESVHVLAGPPLNLSTQPGTRTLPGSPKNCKTRSGLKPECYQADIFEPARSSGAYVAPGGNGGRIGRERAASWQQGDS